MLTTPSVSRTTLSSSAQGSDGAEGLHLVLGGRFELELDAETLALEPDDAVVVSPDERRRLLALEDGVVLVVRAPGTKDDGVRLD